MLIESQKPKQLPKDTIQVYVRVRPLNRQEEAEGSTKLVEIQKNSIILKKAEKKNSKVYTFDSVYSSKTTQEDIFKKIGQNLIENFLNGYNCSIFAYGQTGAGKTYTMMGDLQKEELIGLQPRCIEYLFYLLSEKKSPQTLLKITYVEIYNEKIIDLLSDELRTLNVREDLKKGVFLENATEEVVSNFTEVMEIFKKGLKNRHVSETMMNAQSSRSHSIFTINFQTCVKNNDCSSYKNSVFNFIDLAGSERQRLTKTTGDRFKEGCNINQSLTVLGSVINSLAEKSKGKKKGHIRYRDSKLTFLLKNSLGGNSKTAFIANVSPASSYFLETLSTLMFAKRAKMIKNDAKINENFKSKSLEAMRKELLKTKEELNLMKEKYDLLEKTHYIPKIGFQDKCLKCEEVKRKSDTKILEMDTILKESLIILRKSMIRWEKQLEQNFDSDKEDVINLLKDNSKTIKELVLLLGIDSAKREFKLSKSDFEKENCIINHCKAEIKYYQHQNLNLEGDIKRLMEDFEKVEKILKSQFSSKNINYEKLKNEKSDFRDQQLFNGLEIINKENKIKIDNLNLDQEKLKTELRIIKEDEKKYKNEISVFNERNKMLKSWNEQTLQDKKLLNETIEKIRYEKFNLMKKFDEEFEMTKKKNEKMLEDIEYLEREKNILQEAYNNQNNEIIKLRKTILNLNNEKEDLVKEKIENKQKINFFEIENLNLKNDYKNLKEKIEKKSKENEILKKDLEEKIENFKIFKKENKKILETQINALNNFEEQNSKLKFENEKKTKDIFENEIKNENLEQTNSKILLNLRSYINKFEKSQRSKNNLVKSVTGLKTQSKHFFNSLLNIKKNLEIENYSIFDDFMVASQIKEEKKELEKKLGLKENEISNLKKHLKKILNETMVNTDRIKNYIKNTQSHKRYFLKGLEVKNKEIEFLKKIYKNNKNNLLLNKNKLFLKNLENKENFVKENIGGENIFGIYNEEELINEKKDLEEKKFNIMENFNSSKKRVLFDTIVQNQIFQSPKISKKIKFN